MPTPGLMFVTSRIRDPSKTSDEQYNKFYNDEHLPDVLNYPKTEVSKIAFRYKNISNADGPMPYLALYPLADTKLLTSPDFAKLDEDTRMAKTFGGQNIHELVEFVMRPYEKIQTYEGLHDAKPEGYETSKPEAGTHAQSVICIGMQPAEGQEQDFDDWYRKQHLDMMAMLPHYRRTTRYKRLDGEKPQYLALHEYDCKPADLPKERSMIVGTEWSKKILDESPIFDRDVFELIQVQGDKSLQL